MFNLIINNNNVANSLNNMYQYQFKNGAFEVPENAEIMITSFQIPYSWYNISSRYNNNSFKLYWPTSTVNSTTVTNGGSGYTSLPSVTFTGTPAPTTSVASITVTAGGSGYTSAPTVTIAGSSATATAVITSGAVTSIIVTNVGSGYASVPSVTFSGGGGTGAAATAVLGTNATATAVLTPTSVASLSVSAAGTGYTSVPTVTFTGGGGSGAAATAVLTATTIGSFSVTAGGTAYTSAPTVVFTGGGGTNAAGTAVLTSGVVTSITLTNAGSGYTSVPTISFTGGGGSGAAATPVLTATTVASIIVTNAGSGYTSVPTISVTGGAGSGATSTATLTATSVASITVNGGTGYSASPTVSFSGGGGTGATATASAYTPYTVTIPEGFYTVPALSIWLQSYFIDQKMYLVDASGNNTYYMSFSQNTTYYGNQIIAKQIASTGLTAPSGFPYPPTAFRAPYIEILNNNFTKLMGLSAGNYGRDLSGNLSQLSNITPQAANVNSLIVKCSLVNNGVSNVSDIVDSFAISNGKFGENLNYNNNIEKWVRLSPGRYNNFIVTIVDQNLEDIKILDNNLLINFLIRVKK